MSALTKVLVLLVSAFALFLCGVMVIFVTNSQNYKYRADQYLQLTKAAQVQALVAEEEARRQVLAAYQKSLQEQQVLASVQGELTRLRQEQADWKQQLAQAKRESSIATEMANALQNTNNAMYVTQNLLHKDLQSAQDLMLTAQAKKTELEKVVNSLEAERDQLVNLRKRNDETIHELTDRIEQLSARLGNVNLSTNKLQPAGGVTQILPGEGKVPIRGQITQIEGNEASISIGSSSGVRENTSYNIIRGGHYLGKFHVTYLEPAEAAGRLEVVQGNRIISGDTVTTGFD